MVRHLLRSVALTGLASLFLPLASSGQTIPSPYAFFQNRQEAGPFAGFTGQSTGRYGYGPRPGPLFGARYGIHIGGPFGLEGIVGYSPTTRDVVDPTREEGDRIVGEADAELISLDARLRFSLTGDRTWRRLNPLVFVGLGVVWDAAGEDPADDVLLQDDQFELGARFQALLGTGVRWILSDRLLARADFAITMFRLKTPRGYLDPERELLGVGEREWVSGPGLTIGIGYHF